jgi:flavin-dependent dehydrogenase
MAQPYDVIVVGARCAGSPTAMLLARLGHRVLVVDRSTFPSDAMSTHMIHVPGVAALARWGLVNRLAATGCPPLTDYAFDFGPFTVVGTPRPVEGADRAYAPRRTILDHLLVEAAAEAGVEVHEGFAVDELIVENGSVCGIRGHDGAGRRMAERAEVVVGADGRHSMVAKAVEPDHYHERPPLEAGYYSYWSGVPADTFEVYVRSQRSFAVIPTHDGLSLVVVTWPTTEVEANRHDIEGNFLSAIELAPSLAERLRAGTREARFAGTHDLPNFFRKPFGPGWALVGDAGYHKDPQTAQGITDAFLHAELLAVGLHEVLDGRRSFEDAMLDYQLRRDDAVLPMYDLTCQLASLEPPPPEVLQLLMAAHGNQEASDTFASVIAGSAPVAEFFGPENAERLLAAADP